MAALMPIQYPFVEFSTGGEPDAQLASALRAWNPRQHGEAFKVAQEAIQNGANVHAQNHRGETVLRDALAARNAQIVQLLLDHKANTETRDNLGVTPLMRAVDQLEPLTALINAKANPNAQSQGGLSALWIASGKHDGDVAVCPLAVAMLLKADANPKLASEEGETPLMRACKNLRHLQPEIPMSIARQLITAGADVNAKDRKGNTALMHAARLRLDRGGQEIIQLLIDFGADKTLRNNEGKTAEEIARRPSTTKATADFIRDCQPKPR